MNEAATKAYMKDVSEGADMTSRAISLAMNESEKQNPRKQVDPFMGPVDPFEDENLPSVSKKSAAPAATEVKEQSMWCEALNDEGYTYYWNVKTNGE